MPHQRQDSNDPHQQRHTHSSEHSSADSPAAAGKVGALNQRDGGRPRVEFAVGIKGAQTHLVRSQRRPLSNGKNDAVDAITGHGVATVETVVVHRSPLRAADRCVDAEVDLNTFDTVRVRYLDGVDVDFIDVLGDRGRGKRQLWSVVENMNLNGDFAL